ncbi:acyltransferase [Sphingomonas aurantiaca]|uniref:acyltransferase family protein n=1 Tax=Sphingomonas aurantiaca TaxID=185949 RepID=UPI002FE0B8B3
MSGFLITGMIAKQLSEKRFSFKAFYFRRAKRLLPAAYVTFAMTSVAASFLLTAQDYLLFARQVFGAVTFTANIFLSRQGSYFGGEADLKPLLHTWSLSIEEQYYVIVPAMLAFLPMRLWLRVALILTAISLAACIVAGYRQPSLAFYMFPMRAWEMGIGSVGALITGRASVRRIVVPLFWPALATIPVLLVFPIGGLHPGADAVLACFATPS